MSVEASWDSNPLPSPTLVCLAPSSWLLLLLVVVVLLA